MVFLILNGQGSFHSILVNSNEPLGPGRVLCRVHLTFGSLPSFSLIDIRQKVSVVVSSLDLGIIYSCQAASDREESVFHNLSSYDQTHRSVCGLVELSFFLSTAIHSISIICINWISPSYIPDKFGTLKNIACCNNLANFALKMGLGDARRGAYTPVLLGLPIKHLSLATVRFRTALTMNKKADCSIAHSSEFRLHPGMLRWLDPSTALNPMGANSHDSYYITRAQCHWLVGAGTSLQLPCSLMKFSSSLYAILWLCISFRGLLLPYLQPLFLPISQPLSLPEIAGRSRFPRVCSSFKVRCNILQSPTSTRQLSRSLVSSRSYQRQYSAFFC